MASEMKIDVKVYRDSKLVIDKLLTHYESRNDLVLYNQATQLLGELDNIMLKHIPKKQNLNKYTL